MYKYEGTKFDDIGISKSLRRKHALVWEDIVSVSTAVVDSQWGKYYRTELESASGKVLVIKCRKNTSSFSNLPEYCEVLVFILGKVPENIVFEKTHFVAKWGTEIGNAKEREQALKYFPDDIRALKSLANLYWVKFEFRRARNLFQKGLRINPNDLEILEALALIDRDQKRNIQRIVDQYEYILSTAPNDDRYLRMISILSLNVDEERGEGYARRLLTIRPDEILVRIALAFYYFRRDFLAEAKATLRELGSVSNRQALKEFSKRQLEYIERYETDRNFRMKEKVRALVRLIGFWLIIIIPALFFLYRIVEFVLRMFKT